METTKKLYRQGDVLFCRIPAPRHPERAVRADGIILHGEATGHAHSIADLSAAEIYDVADGAFLCVSASGGVSVVHDEHAPILLPAGHYRVIRQREYSPAEIRNVLD